MSTWFSLQGKRAWISGGANGIGYAVAKRFASAGADVVISDITDAKDTAKKIGAAFVKCDVSNETDVEAALESAVTRKKLDIIVNNAGIVPRDNFVGISDGEDASLRRVFEVNTFGVFYGLKHAPAVMNDGGSIINTSSLASYLAVPGNSQYAATKAAVDQLTRSSAVELGPRGIRVNAVCPSFLKTEMGGGELGVTMSRKLTALGRIGELQDIVGLYHFLASDESSFLTGQIISLDGGWSAGVSSRLFDECDGS